MARRSFTIAAPCLALGLGISVVEILLRIGGLAYPVWERPIEGLSEWGVPHAEGWAVGETRMYVTLNAEGMRDVDHEVRKPGDTLRVVVVGDSYAAAYEVEQGEAFWAVAERALESCPGLAPRTVEVINVSKRGFGTTEELLALRRFGFRYDPDWVVLAFLTGNDFRNNLRALKDSKRPYFVRQGSELVLDESYAESPSRKRELGWRGDLSHGLLRVSRVAQLIRHLRLRIKLAIELAGAPPAVAGGRGGLDDEIYLETDDATWASAWQITEDIIRLMRDEVEREGARFLLMTLSNPIQVDPDEALREAYRQRIGARDLFRPDRRLAAFAAAEGIASLGVAPEILRWAEENETCVHGFAEPYLCQGHWNALGHRLAGEMLAQDLCQRISDSIPAVPLDPAAPAHPSR